MLIVHRTTEKRSPSLGFHAAGSSGIDSCGPQPLLHCYAPQASLAGSQRPHSVETFEPSRKVSNVRSPHLHRPPLAVIMVGTERKASAVSSPFISWDVARQMDASPSSIDCATHSYLHLHCPSAICGFDSFVLSTHHGLLPSALPDRVSRSFGPYRVRLAELPSEIISYRISLHGTCIVFTPCGTNTDCVT